MKILVDENIPKMTVYALRERGFEVIDIRGSKDEGMNDNLLWKRAQSERALLITTDVGFARQHGAKHHGVLIVRLRKPNRRKIHDRVMSAIDQFSRSIWPNRVVIMQDQVQRVWSSKAG